MKPHPFKPAHCQICGTQIHIGRSYCDRCRRPLRRQASVKGWRTRKLRHAALGRLEAK